MRNIRRLSAVPSSNFTRRHATALTFLRLGQRPKRAGKERIDAPNPPLTWPALQRRLLAALGERVRPDVSRRPARRGQRCQRRHPRGRGDARERCDQQHAHGRHQRSRRVRLRRGGTRRLHGARGALGLQDLRAQGADHRHAAVHHARSDSGGWSPRGDGDRDRRVAAD